MPFRLRYLAHDFELPLGEFVLGRGAECQLSVDDPLVSRRHALLRVTRDGIVAEDLGSRNGVLVNGVRIKNAQPLNDGDKVKIGSQEMTLSRVEDAARRPDDPFRKATQTLGGVTPEIQAALDSIRSEDTSKVSARMNAFKLLGGVADKALAMGRADEAERILQNLLVETLTKTREGEVLEPDAAEYAARYAARLAGVTAKGRWVDYVFELYVLLRKPLPAQVVDELYTVLRKVKSFDLKMLRDYVAELRLVSAQLGPAERFVVQRIEGLERLGSLK